MKAKYIWAWIGVLVPVVGICLFPVWQKLFLWIGSDVLPPCFFYQATGIPCPGCGLTRSVLSLLHGDATAGKAGSARQLVYLYLDRDLFPDRGFAAVCPGNADIKKLSGFSTQLFLLKTD